MVVAPEGVLVVAALLVDEVESEVWTVVVGVTLVPSEVVEEEDEVVCGVLEVEVGPVGP